MWKCAFLPCHIIRLDRVMLHNYLLEGFWASIHFPFIDYSITGLITPDGHNHSSGTVRSF